jgi:GntR family transcriptional regulator
MSQANPVSQRLHEDLWSLIKNADPGVRLPSEPKLARSLGVSRATLREAMRTFETQGLIRRRQGSGTYITPQSQVIETGLEVLESIERMAQRIGLAVTMGEMKCEKRLATQEEANALQISEESTIVSISRVILAEERPVAYLVDILPEDVLTPEELSSGFTGSVLDLLIRCGNPPLEASRTEINAVPAPGHVARAMGLQRGDVLLLFTAELYSTTNQMIDYSFSYFLPGGFRFHILRRIGA